MWRCVFILGWLGVWGAWAAPSLAEPERPDTQCSQGVGAEVLCVRKAHFSKDVCQALETNAQANGLAPGFFARLIWQESRFDPNAVSHANAQGIAQFIPATAARRGLQDPFNPAEALDQSARLLGDLVKMFGNSGLAAAAYNSGENRTMDFVRDGRRLPKETRDYIKIITGLTGEDWRDAPPKAHDFRLEGDTPFQQACLALAKNRRVTPFPKLPKRTPEKPTEPKIAPFGVQMAFGVTKKTALAQYKQRAGRCARLTKGETPDLIWQKSRASPKGGYFMARIGRSNEKEAWKYCTQLKKSGCLCAVYPNR